MLENIWRLDSDVQYELYFNTNKWADKTYCFSCSLSVMFIKFCRVKNNCRTCCKILLILANLSKNPLPKLSNQQNLFIWFSLYIFTVFLTVFILKQQNCTTKQSHILIYSLHHSLIHLITEILVIKLIYYRI